MTRTLHSRREWLLRSACGFGHLAMLGLVAQEAGGATPDREPVGSPLAPRPPHYPARGQAGSLPVHARRRLACRYLRPEAEAPAAQRPAATGRETEVRVRPDGKPAGVALEIPAPRSERDRGERALSEDRLLSRRDLRHPLDVRGRPGVARPRAAEHQHRQRCLRPPLPGGLDTLRPGDREPEPPRLPQPQPVSLSRRGPELRLGIPPRDVPRDSDRGRQHAFQGRQALWPLSGRRSSPPAIAARPARAAESSPPRADGRGSARWRPGSLRSRWPSGCRRRPPA